MSPSESDALSPSLALQAFVAATLSFLVSGAVLAGVLVALAHQVFGSQPFDPVGPLVFGAVAIVPLLIGIRGSRRVRRAGTSGAFAKLALVSPALFVIGAIAGGCFVHHVYSRVDAPLDVEELCESFPEQLDTCRVEAARCMAVQQGDPSERSDEAVIECVVQSLLSEAMSD